MLLLFLKHKFAADKFEVPPFPVGEKWSLFVTSLEGWTPTSASTTTTSTTGTVRPDDGIKKFPKSSHTFLHKSDIIRNSPKSHQNIWNTFARQFVAQNKLPKIAQSGHTGREWRSHFHFSVYFERLKNGPIPASSLFILVLSTWQNSNLIEKSIVDGCLGLEPGVVGWKAQTNALSYGSTPTKIPIFLVVDRYAIVPHNCHYNQNGWLQYEHGIVYKKYSTPCPPMGCGVVERHVEKAKKSSVVQYSQRAYTHFLLKEGQHRPLFFLKSSAVFLASIWPNDQCDQIGRFFGLWATF